jgi:hypothetical protein
MGSYRDQRETSKADEAHLEPRHGRNSAEHEEGKEVTRVAQKSVDGISVTNHKARFTGTVFLEEEEAQAASLDEVLVLVVVAKVQDVQAKLNRSGELDRVNVMKASDARVLTGDLKNILVDRLGLYGSDTVDAPLIRSGDYNSSAPPVATTQRDGSRPDTTVDTQTGEVFAPLPAGGSDGDIEAVGDEPDEEDVFSPGGLAAPNAWDPFDDIEGTVELGSIKQRDPRALQEGALTRQGSGVPNVKPFREEDTGAAVPAGEVIGRIGRPGITRVRNWGEEVPDRG